MITLGLLILCSAIVLALFGKTGAFTWLAALASLPLLFANGAILIGYDPSQILNLKGFPVISPGYVPAFFGLIFSLGFPLGLIYGHHYLKAHPGKGLASHQVWLGLMMLSMQILILVQNSLHFLIAWEIMSLSSFFAIMNDRENAQTVSAALYYFVMMHIGAAFLFVGFGLQFAQTGSWNLAGTSFGPLVKWLLLIGFAFKAGFFPFYSWLPRAHPVAPAHLSGMMSGLMIKTGIFGILLVLFNSSWQVFEICLLLGISLLTAFNGILHAMTESHIKRALAYSSIENIGIIGIGLSFWLLGNSSGNQTMSALGLAGALLHVLNHSLFKPLMFYLSGNILVGTHNLEPDSLGGLGKTMPRTAKLFLLGTFAISALPVMNGFISEFGIFSSILSGFSEFSLTNTLAAVFCGAGFAFVSALALIAFSKIYAITFLGEARSVHASEAREVSAGMLLSPLLLALFCALLGIFGRLGLLVVSRPAQVLGADPAVLRSFAGTLDLISIILVIFLMLAGLIYLLRKSFVKSRIEPTWGCGYVAASPRMQYTGSAFINPLAYFFKALIHHRSHKSRVQGYFPSELHYREEVRDYVDNSIIQFLCRSLLRFYRLFDGIHNGRTNSYITWLLVVLIALLIWVLGGF